MNTVSYNKILITICCATAILLMSCGTHGQKPEEAFEKAKLIRIQSTDKTSALVEIPVPKKQPVLKNTAKLDEWSLYKIETEKIFSLNRTKIKGIRKIANVKDNFLRKLKGLESDNIDLKTKMDEYLEEEKTKREMFMVQINHDANQIGIELNTVLNELGVNNTLSKEK